MIAKYNNISLVVGGSGLVVQIIGFAKDQEPLLFPIGALLLLVGFGYYAKAKGRSPVWGALGLLSIVGLFCLSMLKDLTLDAKQPKN